MVTLILYGVMITIAAIATALVVWSLVIRREAAAEGVSKYAGWSLRLGLALAVLNATAVVLMRVERQRATMVLQAEYGKPLPQRLRSLDEAGLIAAITPLCGDSAVASVVARSVLAEGIHYQDYYLRAYLSELEATRWSDQERREWVRLRTVYGSKIHNATGHSISQPIEVAFFDLREPERVESELLIIEEFKFTVFDSAGNPKAEESIDWSRDDLKRRTAAVENEGRVNMFQTVVLGPGEHGEIEITSEGFERRRNGSLSLETRYRTVNMEIEVTLPDSLYNAMVNFSHPSFNNGTICSQEKVGAHFVARIKGGVLPYQGMLVTWVPKEGQ